jgi:hypothetical protein
MKKKTSIRKVKPDQPRPIGDMEYGKLVIDMAIAALALPPKRDD